MLQKETQDASSFYTVFEEQFNQICGPDDPNPRETIKNRWFFTKLQPHLQELIQAMGAPARISDLILMANCLHALRKEKDKAMSARGPTLGQQNHSKNHYGSMGNNNLTPKPAASTATHQGVEKNNNSHAGGLYRGRGGRGSSRRGRKSSAIVCYNCNKEGHLSYNCPKKPDSSADGPSKSSNVVASLQVVGDSKGYAMPINAMLHLPNGAQTMDSMLDTGGDTNYADYAFMLASGWKAPPQLYEPIEFVDGNKTPCYSIVTVSIVITDSEGRTKTYDMEFHVINMKGFDVIIGKQWLEEEDPIVTSWKERTWQYRGNSPVKIKIHKPKCFAKITKHKMLLVIRVDKVKLDSIEGVLVQYAGYASVFSIPDKEMLLAENISHKIKL
jgi:hypothetical protein